jgi:small-conductance mechanosensitive channel
MPARPLKQFVDSLLDPHTWQGAGIYAVLLIVIAVAVSRLIRTLASRALVRGQAHHLDRAVVQFLTQFAQVIVWIIAVMIFLHVVPALQKLGTALLTGVSVASVVIGLAAQNTLSNFIAGFSLILYRPFEVDDVLTITGPGGTAIIGVIERLSLGYTTLRTFDDRRIVVPNNLMANQVAISSNHAQLRSMAIISVIVPEPSHAEVIRSMLLDVAHHQPDVISVISCLELPLETTGTSLSLRMWCRSDSIVPTIKTSIIGEIRETAAEKHIDVLLPRGPAAVAQEPKA